MFCTTKAVESELTVPGLALRLRDVARVAVLVGVAVADLLSVAVAVVETVGVEVIVFVALTV